MEKMNDIEIFLPIFDTKCAYKGSNINPFEEFMYYAVDKHYDKFSNTTMTVRELCDMDDEDFVKWITAQLPSIDVGFEKDAARSEKTDKGSDHPNGVLVVCDGSSVSTIFRSDASFEMTSNKSGARSDRKTLYMTFGSGSVFDFALDSYSINSGYTFNEIPDSKEQVAIFLSIVAALYDKVDYAKFRKMNSFKSNNILPSIKSKLGLDDEDTTTFLHISYGIDSAVVVYNPSKEVNGFEGMVTKVIPYKTFFKEIEEFVKEVKHEN